MSVVVNRARTATGTVEAPATTASPPAYVGIVTRAIAFAVDAAVIQVVAIAVAGTLALIVSIVSPPDELDGVVVVAGSVAYGLWLVGYFVGLWSVTGQTLGSRLLEIRVCRAADGSVPSAGGALVRFAGLILAAVPLFAGFLPILVDDRRRGVHDMLARTVVVSAPRT
jgi:uncharacterized RDD family membrane protein YckC